MSTKQLFIDSVCYWTVSKLKDELRRFNLDSTGQKSTLVLRLQNHYESMGLPNELSETIHEKTLSATYQTPHARSLLDQSFTMLHKSQQKTNPFTSREQPSKQLFENTTPHQPQAMLTTLHEYNSTKTNRCDSIHENLEKTNPFTPRDHLSTQLFADDETTPHQPSNRQPTLHGCIDKINSTHSAKPNPFLWSPTNPFSPANMQGLSNTEKPQSYMSNPTQSTAAINLDRSTEGYGVLKACKNDINSSHDTAHQRQSHPPKQINETFVDTGFSSQSMPRYPQHQVLSTPQIHSQLEELEALELQLKILKTKEEVRLTSQRLSMPVNHQNLTNVTTSSQADVTSMLALVKKSVDIQGLPPAKPFVFSGNPLVYHQWKTVFNLLIEDKDLSAAQKFCYLQSYLEGKAQRCVQAFAMLNTEEAYLEARKALDERYGDPLYLADSFRTKLERWPTISKIDGEKLQEYADFLKQCTVAMNNIIGLDKLNDPKEIKQFAKCLPSHIILRWSRESGLKKLQTKQNPTFKEFAQFVETEAMLAIDKVTSYSALTDGTELATSFSVDTPVASRNNTYKAPECTTKEICQWHKDVFTHSTADCRSVARLSDEDQQDFFGKEMLCFGCAKTGHVSNNCPRRAMCKIWNCSKQHPTCLHYNRLINRVTSFRASLPSTNKFQTQRNLEVPDTEKMMSRKMTFDYKGSKADNMKVLHPISAISTEAPAFTAMIVPVYIASSEDKDKEILVYALLDSMASTSIIRQDICNALHIRKERKRLKVSTITDICNVQVKDRITNLQVRGFRSKHSERITIPTLYTQDTIPVNKTHIPTPETARSWKHLQHIQNSLVSKQSCEVGLIIGYNCSAASLPLTTVRHSSDLTLPYAVQTTLGWSVVGGKENNECFMSIHRVNIREITTDHILERLEDDLSTTSNLPMKSQNDVYFLKKMKDSVKMVDGHYTMPLPFKERPLLPDNRAYALKRFESLEHKLDKNQEYKQKYQEFMNEIISNKEAERVHKTSRGWYIPHHGVFHSKKPGKLRVVFDCSSNYKGQSLNRHLLKGPDLNSSLAGVLCRFRKEKVAVTCDIKKMFHQFRVNPEDRQFLRFLWYDNMEDRNVVDYQMNVHLFGATSSPSCAIYGLQKAADDFSHINPTACTFVKEHFYVDDGLISVATAAQAIELIRDTKVILSKGNLILHKFLSNSDEVAAALECDGPTTKFFSKDVNCDRTLGISWNVKEDTFSFPRLTPKPCTRRGVLSTVSSLFDPLGLLAPFTLQGKLILQSLCSDGRKWDEPLNSAQQALWKTWTNGLSSISEQRFPRCIMSANISSPYTVEIHNFSDASSKAYAMCSYIRLVNHTSKICSVSLAFSKSRVAPKKVITIPRLELQAATLAVKVSDFLKEELKYEDIKTFFWTDSKTVLGYVSNDARKFYVFVSNRVQRIRDSSKPEQWHYISSKQNPADIASRGTSNPVLPYQWLNGPDFLQNPMYTPTTVTQSGGLLNPDDAEIRKVFIHSMNVVPEDHVLHLLESYSSWKKVKGVISCIRRFGIRDKSQDNKLDSTKVFQTIIKLVQKKYYFDETTSLSSNVSISKSSSLYKLDPFLDNEGILRVGERLKNALSTFSEKHPIVLPSCSPLTKLYIKDVHNSNAHQGRNTTLNAIRTRGIHISGKGVKLVSSVIFNCVACRKIRGKPATQVMANLPTARTEPSPPFACTGMDVFGPFQVKDGRKECKRYALLFTCMATRGIHIELLNDLSTDSFLNALRTFFSLRGPANILFADRGTNFVGARNELNKAMSEMSQESVQRYLDSMQCIFQFNTPTASHMGGSWERLIRTVRNVMNGILVERHTIRLTSTSLRTLLHEAAYIVNSRPLTVDQLTSESSIEPLPITPNHLLTMKAFPLISPPGHFTEADLCSRKQWRRVQYLTELFWNRWKNEYLHSQLLRHKWNKAQPNLAVNDIVLLVETDLPRCDWSLARITKVLLSSDGLIRKVILRTSKSRCLERPIHKLIPLVTAANI